MAVPSKVFHNFCHSYRITIAYDGTSFVGWQIQPNGISIQGLIQDAVRTITQEPTFVVGSGRTDAGVHALGQVAHFRSDQDLDPLQLRRSLNGLLPPEIRITSAEHVPATFHAQYSATGKVYHYHLHLDPVDDPFRRHYHYHVLRQLDVPLLKEASQCFVGTHDFKAVTNRAEEGAAAKNSVRHLYRIDCVEQDGGLRLEFEGNGFLYKMVRNIVGTLLQFCTIPAKRQDPLVEIPKILESKDRKQGGRAAAARGLFLVKVRYPELEADD